MPYDPEIAQRVMSEGSYTVESYDGGYGAGLLLIIGVTILTAIVSYKLYRRYKKK